ncbi:MAG: DUF1326 domain-containing protein [Tepidisphaeraceae bacterium]
MKLLNLARCLPVLLASYAVAASPAGDYVEARTASVFAGACHYNGERVTEGKSAIMAWSIKAGEYNGVDLAGVRLLAVVGCDDNLAEANATRKTELTVDADSDTKAAAAVAWVKATVAGQIGEVVAVRRSAVTFKQASDVFTVNAAGEASMTVKAMPDRACCLQPNLVWYTPLMPIENQRVGYTEVATYTAGRVGNTWERTAENSAFYGTFGR